MKQKNKKNYIHANQFDNTDEMDKLLDRLQLTKMDTR